MRIVHLTFLLTLFCVTRESSATAASRAAARELPGTSAQERVGRGATAAPEGIAPGPQSNRQRAIAWAEETRRTIAPTLHTHETEHFLIFSAWNPSQDRGLGKVCEAMYSQLRTQFRIAPGSSVWPEKLPIYIFWDKSQFQRFTSEVDSSLQRRSPEHRQVNGYHASKGNFSYIVINGVMEPDVSATEAINKFYHVLVHEGTHAFMRRWVTTRPIPVWTEEGVADYMSAILVPSSEANQRALRTMQQAITEPVERIAALFSKSELDPIDYGYSQSLVRYLILINNRAFVQFVDQLKRGTDEATALKQTYGLTREKLIEQWLKHCRTQIASMAGTPSTGAGQKTGLHGR
jgi:hypothetical protein